MSKSTKLLINNVLLSDYTAQIEIGADKNVANVILDTGSSTLAVWNNKFGESTGKNDGLCSVRRVWDRPLGGART